MILRVRVLGAVLLTLLATIIPTIASSQSTTALAQNYSVYDGTLYRNKPDLSQHGLQSIAILGRQLWGNDKPGEALPNEDRIRLTAQEIAALGTPIVLDIEHWPLQGRPELVQNNLNKYLTVLRWFHEVKAPIKVGYYGTVPIRDYWRAIKDVGHPEHQAWRAENDRLRSLALAVDVLFPSLYTFYDDREGWRRYAIAQIAQARRFGGGKPIYVFLWPQFHDSNRGLKGTYLPVDFWRLELETAREYADGVVIWGGWGADNRPAQWDEQAEWWQVTKGFLAGVSHNETNTSSSQKRR